MNLTSTVGYGVEVWNIEMGVQLDWRYFEPWQRPAAVEYARTCARLHTCVTTVMRLIVVGDPEGYERGVWDDTEAQESFDGRIPVEMEAQ